MMEEDKKKGGLVCSFKNCKNKSYDGGNKFYRFPQDIERARFWLLACDRPDLQDKVDKLYKSHRICEIHFPSRMFKKGKRHLLRKDAVPVKLYSESVIDEAIPNTSGLNRENCTSVQSPDPPSILKQLLEPASSIDSSSDKAKSPLRSPTCYVQTPVALTINTPRKDKLRHQIMTLRNENKELKKHNQELISKCGDLEKKLSKKKEEICTLEEYKNMTYALCPSKELAEFITIQMNQIAKSARGRRYTNQFKFKCLSLYFSGPKVYKSILTKLFCLPGPRTLTRLLRGLDIPPGLEVPNVFKTLKIKVDHFNEMDKYCVICVDEMSIKANFFFNSSEDYIIGLEDPGNGERVFKPARTATVLLVRGLFSNWKQPLSYYFYNSTCPGIKLKYIILDAIQRLKNIGLNIIVLVSDMGSNNIQFKNLMQITPEKPYFIFDNQKIFFIFDVPHLIKAMRNMLLKYVFSVFGNIVSWKYIVKFYNTEKGLVTKSATKLTDSHIFPSNFEKMKVKYATQVFSATVSSALKTYIGLEILPENAQATADFIEKIDKLFDLLNSSNTSGCKKFNLAFRGLDFQVDFLNEALPMFESLKVFNNLNEDVTNKVKFIVGFKITINSVLHLWNFLKAKQVHFLFTRRLNQDPLENLFGIIRQQNANCVNPTARQFKTGFRKVFCVKLLNSGTENCENDMNDLLIRVSDVIKDHNLPIIQPSLPQRAVIDTSYQKDTLLETNFVRYFAGYLIKKCLVVHSCETCTAYSKAYQDLDETSLFCYYKAYENANLETFGNLNMPHNNFVQFISSLETIFQINFESIVLQPNVIQTFEGICQNINYSHPCKQFPIRYLIKLFGRVRLFHTLKCINRNFKTVKNKKVVIWKNK